MSEGDDAPAPRGDAAPSGDTLHAVFVALLTGGWQLALLGFLPGVTLWAWFAADRARLLANTLEPAERMTALGCGVASLVFVVLVHLGAYRRGQARGLAAFAAQVRRANRLMFVVVLGPLVPLLTATPIAAKRPWLLLSTVTAIGVAAAVFVYRALDSRRGAACMERIGGWRPSASVARIVAVVAAGLVALALIDRGLTRHHALQSNTYDLGIFTNIVWNSSVGRPLACTFLDSGTHMSQHFDPILVLLAPLAWLARVTPLALSEWLIVIQALLLCAGAIPLYRLSVRALGHPLHGAWMVAVYLLYPPLHANALWDFHSLTLAVPAILFFADALDDRAPTRRWVTWLVVVLLVREELALVAVLFAAVVALERRAGDDRRWLWIVAAALTYFLAVALAVAPGAGLAAHGGRYADVLRGSTGGVAGLAAAVAANPSYVVGFTASTAKVAYLLALLVPLLLLPLAAPRWLLPGALGLAVAGLASSHPVSDVFFHYSALVYPALMLATPKGVARLRDLAARAPELGVDPRRLVASLCVGALAASLAFTAQFGAFTAVFGIEGNFRAGFTRPATEVNAIARSARAWTLQVAERVPADASLAVSGFLGPHVAARPDVRHFPSETGTAADYLLLWTAELNHGGGEQLRALVQSGAYTKLGRAHGVILYQRQGGEAVPALTGRLPLE